MNTHDSFIRWQDISIRQLGFTTNLVLSLNIAVLGFMISKIIDPQFILPCNGKALYTIGLFILSFCLIPGLVINITRLYDYRLTAKIARKRKTGPDSKLNELRKTTKNLGKATWLLLLTQLSLFGLGLISVFLCFLIIYSNKLFL